MKKIYFTCLTIICLNTISSQNLEIGKVTIDELKQKNHPKDSSATAAVLFKKGTTTFDYSQSTGFVMITEVEMKIKVYKKQGLGFGNFSVGIYNNDKDNQTVDFSKAITYNLENGAIVKTKAKSESEFKEVRNKYYSIVKIAMPNVKEGAIVELKYTIRSPFITQIPDWEFQMRIPVDYSEFTTEIPEYYTYTQHLKGVLQPLELRNSKSRNLTITEKNLNNSGGYVNTFGSMNYNVVTTNYKLSNIPALKEESFVNNIDNYSSTLLLELSKIEYPNVAPQYFATSWDAVAKKIIESDEFGAQLSKTGYFDDDITSLLKPIQNEEEKISAIFSFVKNKMNWNRNYGYLCDEGIKKAYQTQTGNAAEINLMLVAMLRYAGFDANPILLSTRSNGIALFPSRTAYNYVIAGIQYQNDFILLDATNKFSLPNILPFRDLNWFGRMLYKDGTTTEIDMAPNFISSNTKSMFADLTADGKFSGKFREQHSDYNAFEFRNINNDIGSETYLEKLEKNNLGTEISNYSRANATDLSQPIIENYEFQVSNKVEIIGSKMLFSPLLHLATSKNPFSQETRSYPIDFSFPKTEKYNIRITIPDGYKVESIPKSESFTMDGGAASFTFNCVLNGNQIQIVSSTSINQSIISASDYPILKQFFKQVVEKENEKIVITKN